MFEDVRVGGHLIARIDRQRFLIEIKNKRGCYLIDLAEYFNLSPNKGEPTSEEEPMGNLR